jgi:cell wall-associated NlpC family hydrolase
LLRRRVCGPLILTVCMTICLFGGGCANRQTERSGLPASTPGGNHAGMHTANRELRLTGVPVQHMADGSAWVPLGETAKALGLRLYDVNGSVAMGDTDAAYRVKVGQTEAKSGDHTIRLPQAPAYIDRMPYMTTKALSTLLGTRVSWSEQSAQLVITPIDDRALSVKSNRSGSRSSESASGGRTRSLAAAEIDKKEVITYAEKFAGTPYRFGSDRYDTSHTFDCSSFVQYVYDHFGVDLPRSSRDQAQTGQAVEAAELQPGDLLFFNTPGRFENNRMVGHVGIYTGGGQFIHTYGKPGVTTNDFNGNWKDRFLFAKRVA